MASAAAGLPPTAGRRLRKARTGADRRHLASNGWQPCAYADAQGVHL